MSNLIRALAAVLLTLVAAFCVFGFLATYEPMPRSSQIVYRVLYGSIGCLGAAAVIWIGLTSKRISKAP